MCCCSKQPVRGEKTPDPRTGCIGDYISDDIKKLTFCCYCTPTCSYVSECSKKREMKVTFAFEAAVCYESMV